ncbi:hypothetical protein OG21DRAFT_207767 [Imleria badia]|nr:hypothetical protein OG21DRAFT_207767 [Imleria badia]
MRSMYASPRLALLRILLLASTILPAINMPTCRQPCSTRGEDFMLSANAQIWPRFLTLGSVVAGLTRYTSSCTTLETNLGLASTLPMGTPSSEWSATPLPIMALSNVTEGLYLEQSKSLVLFLLRSEICS